MASRLWIAFHHRFRGRRGGSFGLRLAPEPASSLRWAARSCSGLMWTTAATAPCRMSVAWRGSLGTRACPPADAEPSAGLRTHAGPVETGGTAASSGAECVCSRWRHPGRSHSRFSVVWSPGQQVWRRLALRCRSPICSPVVVWRSASFGAPWQPLLRQVHRAAGRRHIGCLEHRASPVGGDTGAAPEVAFFYRCRSLEPRGRFKGRASEPPRPRTMVQRSCRSWVTMVCRAETMSTCSIALVDARRVRRSLTPSTVVHR
jgi:hypothetical protein